MTPLPETDPPPSPAPVRLPVDDAAGRLLAAMLAVADAAGREPELVEAAGRR